MNTKIQILSKINVKDKNIIQNNSFKDIDLNNSKNLGVLIDNLKIIYEDFWKDNNLINTSINLPLFIKVKNKDFDVSLKFEETLDKIDLIKTKEEKENDNR